VRSPVANGATARDIVDTPPQAIGHAHHMTAAAAQCDCAKRGDTATADSCT
jgi:hypothetical protein